MRARTSDDIDTAAKPLRQQLAHQLVLAGLLADPGWGQAVELVPRHWFVPGFYTDSGRRDDVGLTLWEPVTADLDPQGWLAAIYQDRTLITQFEGDEPDWDTPAVRVGGSPSSSSTLPSLVLRMWADADLAEGQDVLEIGTGTGYSTALYSERYGSARLTSIEIDPDRLDQAAAGLFRCGYGPRLAMADGLYGYAPYAPYDRIVAACSVRRIPQPWLEQLKVGGKILTTLCGWLNGSARVLLTMGADGTATGNLLPGTISFMIARADYPPSFGNPAHWAALVADAEPRTARHSPARLYQADEEGFHGVFIAQLAAPGTQYTTYEDVTYLIDTVTGSVATLTRDGDGWQVRQAGPVRLWGRIETALDVWDNAGRPGPQQFTMRIGRDGRQRVELPTATGLSFVLP
jgi:methyltransferase of ATP-grasp peptide maturase system